MSDNPYVFNYVQPPPPRFECPKRHLQDHRMKVALEILSGGKPEPFTNVETASAPLPSEIVMIGTHPHMVEDRLWTYDEALNSLSVKVLLRPMSREKAAAPGIAEPGVIIGRKL